MPFGEPKPLWCAELKAAPPRQALLDGSRAHRAANDGAGRPRDDSTPQTACRGAFGRGFAAAAESCHETGKQSGRYGFHVTPPSARRCRRAIMTHENRQKFQAGAQHPFVP